MERYLLLFSFGSNNDYGEDLLNLAINYLASLNDEQQFYSRSQFLKYFNVISVKVALVLLNQDGNKVQWKSVDVQDTDSLRKIILESKQIETNKLRSKLKPPEVDPMKTAIENFHELADALPYSGSFLLDLVWLYTEDDQVCAVEENYELYGALKRLVNWHNGQITMIVPEKNTVNKDIAGWMKFLNGIIFPITTASKTSFPSNLIWRGKLHVKDAKLCTEVSLPGFQLQYITSKCFHSLHNAENSHIQMDQACFSVKMEIVESISSDSIPLYVITSEKYHLGVINAKASVKQSSKWFANIIRNPEISFILRLGYIDEGLPPYSFNIFNPTTKNWIQSISNGNFKFSVPNISGDSKQILFLLTGNKFNTTSCTTLYRLRNPDELNGSISHQIFMNMPLCEADNEDSEAQDYVAENVAALPYLNQMDFSVFLELICDVQNQIIENWLDHLESQGLTRDLSQEELSFALRMIQNELVKRMNPYIETGKESETSRTQEQIKELIPEYLVDPNDWSERRAILNQEILAEKFKRFKSTDTLAGMFPPSLDNAQMWNCSQILKCFHKSGLPSRHHMKNAVAIGSIEAFQCPLRAVVSELEMLSLNWPDIKHCHFHDIYYNRDDSSEQLEERFCKIKERFIRHEISSTHLRADSEKKMLPLCKNSLSDGWTLSTCASKSTSEGSFTKKNKGHSNETANKTVSPRRSPRKKGGLETSKILRRSPRKHHSSHLNKSTAGSRNSPSFKQKFQTTKKYSHHQKSNLKNNCSKKLCSDSTLSEPHTKKLREAVYNALSSEGIDMDHKLFKVCGKKLFRVCKTLIHDVLGTGRTSKLMRTIAQAHVKQVVEFEKLLEKKS